MAPGLAPASARDRSVVFVVQRDHTYVTSTGKILFSFAPVEGVQRSGSVREQCVWNQRFARTAGCYQSTLPRTVRLKGHLGSGQRAPQKGATSAANAPELLKLYYKCTFQ